jgi:hypothetical protein
MMRLIRRQNWVIFWCSLVMIVPRPALAAALVTRLPHADGRARGTLPTVGDVALRTGGQLVGQVLSDAGSPLASSPVTIRQQGRELGRTVTDANGVFAVAGLRGGTYTVAAAGAAVAFRLWAPGTAPPSAVHSAMVVAGERIVRAQGQQACVRPPRSSGGRVGYSRLGALLRNPWVIAALVGTAIAVPIATADNGNNSAS